MLTPREQFIITRTLCGWQVCDVLAGDAAEVARVRTGMQGGSYSHDPHSTARWYELDARGITLTDRPGREGTVERVLWRDVAAHAEGLPEAIRAKLRDIKRRQVALLRQELSYPSRRADPEAWEAVDAHNADLAARRHELDQEQSDAIREALPQQEAAPEPTLF